ncbi:hypothetical protein Dda_5445 [Drechslerella dactyloides]|uniref:Uncharacterized protein n=1 Tax=Drechslerella dactyloides TaxID=74499 RepID=A0AAD6IXJ1_DREDA|nr:hypothetical protein Dda_5445 [Drechslerella dactyloides]
MASQSDLIPLDESLPAALPVAVPSNLHSRDPNAASSTVRTTPVRASVPVDAYSYSFLQLEYECLTATSSSTVMIFNPDFSFAGTIRTTTTTTTKTSHSRTRSRGVAHIRGKSTSWLDGESPVTPASATRLTITTPTCKYDVDLDLEVPLSPKSLPAHMHPFFTLGDAAATCDSAGYAALVRRDVAAKLSVDRGKPNRRRPLPLHFASGLDCRRTATGGFSPDFFRDAARNAEMCGSRGCGDITEENVDIEASTEKCTGSEGKSILLENSNTIPISLAAADDKKCATVTVESVTATPPPTPRSPKKAANLKKLRPKLRLRTSLIVANQRAPTPQPIINAPTGAHNSNNNDNISKDRSTRSTSPPDVSRPSSQRAESETSTSRRPTQAMHRRRTSSSRLPLHALLLSPLGARRRFSSDSTATSASISSTITTDTSVTHSRNNSTSDSYGAPANCNYGGCSGGSLGRVRGSVFSFRLHEVDEEEEDTGANNTNTTTEKERPDMVGGRKEENTKEKERDKGGRFRRFSLAYLGAGDDGDGAGGEARSPHRSWRSWSRLSVASINSNTTNADGAANTNATTAAERVNNSRSFGRRSSRFSMASQSTSHASTNSSGDGSSCTGLTSGPSSSGTRYSDGGERHRQSLSGSSVAELAWGAVPVTAYAHLMSSWRNSSAVNANAATKGRSDAGARLSAASAASDGSSVREIVERCSTAVRVPWTPPPLPPVGEDPFTAFCEATKPRVAAVASRAGRRGSHEERAAKVTAQILAGGFYDSESEDEDEEEGCDGLHRIAEEDGEGDEDVSDWWMEEGEEEWRGVPRVPSLEFGGNSNRESVEGPLPLTPTEVYGGFMTSMEEKKRRRRRTASSECLIVEAAEGLRGVVMYSNVGEADECAVE